MIVGKPMIFGVLGLVAVGVLFRTWTSGTENGIRVVVQPREYRELEALLLELRRTWQPSARCRLLEKVRHDGATGLTPTERDTLDSFTPVLH